MPASFTRAPAETERKEPGIGGKPPVDRRPTGGGGGGGDDDWNDHGRGPRELLYRIRTFVFLALACDMVVFVVLVIVFYLTRTSMRMNYLVHGPNGIWHQVELPPILYLNTALLILSTLTMERARQSIFHEIDVLEEWLGLGRPALRRALPWVAATLALGLLFLAGQAVAWKQLTAQGFAFDRWVTPPAYFFYLITGAHALHLILGVAALIACLVGLTRFRRVEHRQIAVDATAWYWHTMTVVWLFLLAVLAVGQ